MSFIRRNSLGLGVVVVKLGRDGTAWADEGVRRYANLADEGVRAIPDLGKL